MLEIESLSRGFNGRAVLREVSLAGGVTGAFLGYGLAWAALVLFGGDLGAGYFSGLHPSLQFQPQVMVIHIALGTLAGIAGAWLPARDAATVSPAPGFEGWR